MGIMGSEQNDTEHVDYIYPAQKLDTIKDEFTEENDTEYVDYMFAPPL